ncbi:hypothetical protein Tco_0156099 [Tanacetum coccineum]
MSNSNTNLQTQSSNALHNAIMEAGTKISSMLARDGKVMKSMSIKEPERLSRTANPPALAAQQTTNLTSSKPSYSKTQYSTPPDTTKIYKPTNNNLRTSSNTSRANQDNSPRINRGTMYDNQREVNVTGARENVEQADWKDDTDDESEDQELEAHYMYMAQLQEVTPDPVDNSGPIFDDEPMHKVQNNNDNYNVFDMENEHPEQPESSNDIYLTEQCDTNITIDSLDICYDRAQDDQDDTDDLDQDRIWLGFFNQRPKK